MAAETTQDQIKSLVNLMDVINNHRSEFRNDPNQAADAHGVNRGLPGIQNTVDHLSDLSNGDLDVIVSLNAAMFAAGLEEKRSTTQVLAKQV